MYSERVARAAVWSLGFAALQISAGTGADLSWLVRHEPSAARLSGGGLVEPLTFRKRPQSTVPVPFFALGLLGLLALHLAIALAPGAVGWPLSGHGILLLHLAVLGWVTPVMMGADYQLVPVVLHRPIGRERLAHLVIGLYTVGVVLFLAGWGFAAPLAIAVGGATAGCALLLFCVHVGAALARTQNPNPTALGLGGGLVALCWTAVLGPWMALSLDGAAPTNAFATLRILHATAALAGWLLLTIMGATYQLVPFFSATEPSVRQRFGAVAVLGAVAGILLLVLAELRVGVPVALGLVVLGVSALLWLVDLVRLARRGRQARREPVVFYSLGGAGALVVGGGASAIGWGTHPHFALAGVFLGLVAGPSLLILGQLQKILPFVAALDTSLAAKRQGKVPKTEALFPRQRAFGLLGPLALGFAVESAGVALALPPLLRIGAIIVLVAAVGYALQQTRALGAWNVARRSG
jgi:hypothetical protein